MGFSAGAQMVSQFFQGWNKYFNFNKEPKFGVIIAGGTYLCYNEINKYKNSCQAYNNCPANKTEPINDNNKTHKPVLLIQSLNDGSQNTNDSCSKNLRSDMNDGAPICATINYFNQLTTLKKNDIPHMLLINDSSEHGISTDIEVGIAFNWIKTILK